MNIWTQCPWKYIQLLLRYFSVDQQCISRAAPLVWRLKWPHMNIRHNNIVSHNHRCEVFSCVCCWRVETLKAPSRAKVGGWRLTHWRSGDKGHMGFLLLCVRLCIHVCLEQGSRNHINKQYYYFNQYTHWRGNGPWSLSAHIPPLKHTIMSCHPKSWRVCYNVGVVLPRRYHDTHRDVKIKLGAGGIFDFHNCFQTSKNKSQLLRL